MANTNLVIKQIAREKGFTLEDIAKRLGIHRTSLSQALTRNNFSMDKLGEIADILEVEIPNLFESNQPTTLVCPHCGKPLHINLS